MELLIPGLVLVALMIYASTRIKRTAAKAFEAETIETDEFVIQKPAGFLHNLNAAPDNVFEAYSKDFSSEHPELRIGNVSIQRLEGQTVDASAEAELARGGTITDDFTELLGERAYRILGIRRSDNTVETKTSFKLAANERGVYKLEVKSPVANSGDQWIETFIDGFRVK
jgi:hypothetical protein